MYTKIYEFPTVPQTLPPADPSPLLAFFHKFLHSEDMEIVQEIARSIFEVDSIWSVVFRGVVWFGIAIVIIVSTDVANPEKSGKSLKSNLGFFLLFLVLSTGLIYLLFGVAGTPKLV